MKFSPRPYDRRQIVPIFIKGRDGSFVTRHLISHHEMETKKQSNGVVAVVNEMLKILEHKTQRTAHHLSNIFLETPKSEKMQILWKQRNF